MPLAATLIGGETEYAVGAVDTRGVPFPQPVLLDELMRYARRTLPYTSTAVNGRFFPNGGLLYLDAGLHLEWASPECTSPGDVVRYLRAGDLIVRRLLDDYAADTPRIARTFCSRANVDYTVPTVWASHESYLHVAPPGRLPAQLVPFLVSRAILSGAGGWDAQAPGLVFTRSPRSRFLVRVTSEDTEHARPIFHTKNEALSRTGSHRLHVSCGESLSSDAASVLRFGATALVLAVIDRGATPGTSVALRAPLAALRRFAEDPGLDARARLADGRRLRAIDLQRHYLAEVVRRLDARGMPAWAGAICARWQAALDDLEAGGAAAATTLDWAIKRRIYKDFLRRRGVDWTALPAVNRAAVRFRRLMVRADPDFRPLPATVLRDPGPTYARMVGSLPWRIEGVEVTAGLLAATLEARAAAFELDARFGELGPRGLFNALDRAGVLTHRTAGVDDAAGAVDTPPPDTRARLRGETIAALSAGAVPYRAEWTRVVDLAARRLLDLGDPFEREARWRPADSTAYPAIELRPAGPAG